MTHAHDESIARGRAALDGKIARRRNGGAVNREGGRISQATRLVDLALIEGVELWHSPTGDPYITLPVASHREHHALASRAVRDWLSRLHYQETRCTPRAQGIADAISNLSGIARYEGKEYVVHVRVGGYDGRIYLDLGRPDWRMVEITAKGWRLVANAPARLRRPRGLLPLPEPQPGGKLNVLRELLHVGSDNDWILITAWLIGALRLTGPYPVLALAGEQGSAKSTATRMLRRLIDPSSAELRAEPREIRDLMIAASSGWIVALDNVSNLPPWLSDGLCRLSTGGALTTRQLYTDGDEHIIEAMRPVILNGITDVVQRGDLQDRAIGVTLPPIADTQRRAEADLWAEYDRRAPGILGALLDAVVVAMQREQRLHFDSLPRMADWVRWTTAAEPALGWRDGTIHQAYLHARHDVIERSLDGDPLALALRNLALPWTGTAADLLAAVTPANCRSPRGWPESPRALSGALRRLAPLLRRVGLVVTLDRRIGHEGRRTISIERVGAAPSAPSASSAHADGADAADGESPADECVI